MNRFHIVVSAENNSYLAWQCKLFHYSCLTRLNLTPTFIVHKSEEKWHDGFKEIVRAGGCVKGAPNYRVSARGYDFPPRNTPATLLHAARMFSGQDVFIVLCDPDMIFVRRPAFPRKFSGDYCSYLNFDLETVRVAQRRMRLTKKEFDMKAQKFATGVPHVIPAAKAQVFAETWITTIDSFPEMVWEGSMYSFCMAAVKLGIKVSLTHVADHNYWPNAPVRNDMIHYCYGDESWDKRDFLTDDQSHLVWNPRVNGRDGSVLKEILSQIAEANQFYRRFEF
jgi:hypothetical protein